MVSTQLVARGIKDENVLSAFEEVPREFFLPDNLKKYAYQDSPLPIGEGQTISQPYITALMTQLLEAGPGDFVLDVGTGSGYQAAILLNLGAKVYGVERYASLAKKAKETIDLLGYDFKIKIGDGTLGWDIFSPYDRIIVAAASPVIPKSLLVQAKLGAKIVIPLGSKLEQKLTLAEKISKDNFKSTLFCGCIFVPLIGKEGWGEK